MASDGKVDEHELCDHSSLRIVGKGNVLDEFRMDTRIVKGGYAGAEWTTDPLGRSIVNPPVWHASTVTFPSVDALNKAKSMGGLFYGRHGTPTTWALEEAFSVLEGADNACAVCSGVAAVAATLMAFVKSGDHLLVSDGVYDPTRRYCDMVRAREVFWANSRSPSEHGRSAHCQMLHCCALVRERVPHCALARRGFAARTARATCGVGAGAGPVRGGDDLLRPPRLRRAARAAVPPHHPGGTPPAQRARRRSHLARAPMSARAAAASSRERARTYHHPVRRRPRPLLAGNNQMRAQRLVARRGRVDERRSSTRRRFRRGPASHPRATGGGRGARRFGRIANDTREQLKSRVFSCASYSPPGPPHRPRPMCVCIRMDTHIRTHS